ncbi:hypothetical protein [Saccharothrix sp.]|uniref:hypothetical protein n=1 Tax=Saccharothrix sp. TaxID=1873460 RepID=UPI002811FD1C|nr:hypothetical protein [Saccharothrix sp.]
MSIRTVSSKVVYENRWLSVREDRIELADGSAGLYSVVDKPDFASPTLTAYLLLTLKERSLRNANG